MLVLTINAGGSSVRLDVYEHANGDNTKLTSKHGDADADPAKELKAIAAAAAAQQHSASFPSSSSSPAAIAAVFHRIVHGGQDFTHPTVITPAVLSKLESLVSLDPLHNPPALRWVEAATSALPSATQIATFDTNFFTSLPPAAQHIPLPPAWVDKHRLRRYGFHGMAHHSMWQTFASLRPDLQRGGRLVTLQLGSGCSAAAILHGQPVDTSMGFGPLQGLLMTTRCGDVDPAAITFLQRVEKVTAEEMEKALYQQSGLLAVSRGESKDMGQLLKSGTAEAKLAVDLFCTAVVKYVGAYAALLGGLDGLVFGGGIGEKGAVVRQRVCERLQWMGLQLDPHANQQVDGTKRISKGDGNGAVDVWVVSVDEAKVMIEEGQHLLKEGNNQQGEQGKKQKEDN